FWKREHHLPGHFPPACEHLRPFRDDLAEGLGAIAREQLRSPRELADVLAPDEQGGHRHRRDQGEENRLAHRAQRRGSREEAERNGVLDEALRHEREAEERDRSNEERESREVVGATADRGHESHSSDEKWKTQEPKSRQDAHGSQLLAQGESGLVGPGLP